MDKKDYPKYQLRVSPELYDALRKAKAPAVKAVLEREFLGTDGPPLGSYEATLPEATWPDKAARSIVTVKDGKATTITQADPAPDQPWPRAGRDGEVVTPKQAKNPELSALWHKLREE